MNLERVQLLLNNARIRSAFAGGCGGLVGWLFAESIVGRPQGWETVIVGGLVGGGIGGILGASEGLAIHSWKLVQRGALIGLLVGVLGGALGAGVAQLGYARTGATNSSTGITASSSVFSAEMQQRLKAANAKPGEVEIALLWQNTDDLDLHVVDPAGERIFFSHKRSNSGGELDVDRNVSKLTTAPVEHVVWPAGSTAPHGNYRVYVHHYTDREDSRPTPFQVELLLDGEHKNYKGGVQYGEPPQLVCEFSRAPQGTQSPPPVENSSFSAALFARLLGWTVFGAVVGCAQGYSRGSRKALRNAILGGSIGGAVGGLFFDVLVRVLLPLGFTDTTARLVGFVILGACIGVWIAVVERALSALLTIRSGRYEGRDIILDKAVMRVGRNDGFEVYLGGDLQVAVHHCDILQEGDGYVLVPVAGRTLVNGTEASGQLPLQNGDALTLGQTRLEYRYRATSGSSNNASPQPNVTSKASPVPPPPAPAQLAPRHESPNALKPQPSKATPRGTTEVRSTPARPAPPPPPPPPRR